MNQSNKTNDFSSTPPDDPHPFMYSGGMIPFSSGNAPLVGTNVSGAPMNAALLTFSSNSPVIQLGTGNSISMDTGNMQYAFSLPQDCTLSAIYTTLANWGTFSAPSGTIVTPYVKIYRAEADENVFYPLMETKTKSPIGYRGLVPANTLLTASKTPAVKLHAGDRLIIAGMVELEGTANLSQTYYFYYTGGLSFTSSTVK